jgi:hypothetical protein
MRIGSRVRIASASGTGAFESKRSHGATTPGS